jgi:nicotinamide-nucleotide amidase
MLRLGGEKLAHQGRVAGAGLIIGGGHGAGRAFHDGEGVQYASDRLPTDRLALIYHAGMNTLNVPDDAALREQAERLGQALKAKHQSLVTAESCTGGWIAKTVTDIAGCSDWFDCGIAAYSYEAKQAMLSVRPETLMECGAVSQETCVEMVSGALIHSGAAVAVAVTGIAGPSGGTADKPVGTVWIGWKRRGGYPEARVFHFDGDREAVRRQTVAMALDGLMRLVKQGTSVG